MAKKKNMTVGRFVTAANEVTIGYFRREHAKVEMMTRKSYEILRILSPCWEKKNMDKVSYAGIRFSRRLCRKFENAYQPHVGLVPSIPQVFVQYGTCLHV